MNFLTEECGLIIEQRRIMAVKFLKDGSNDGFTHEPGLVPDAESVTVFLKGFQLMAVKQDGHFIDPFETRIFVRFLIHFDGTDGSAQFISKCTDGQDFVINSPGPALNGVHHPGRNRVF